MKKMFLSNIIFLCICFSSVNVMAEAIHRISSTRYNRSEVKPIYLAPGLGSVLMFPCGIEEVFIGRSDDLKAQVSPNDKKLLFLNLKLNTSLPTNIILKCESEKSVYVFDVIPSKIKHQDVVDIKSAFGRPPVTDQKTVSVETKPQKIVLKSPVISK